MSITKNTTHPPPPFTLTKNHTERNIYKKNDIYSCNQINFTSALPQLSLTSIWLTYFLIKTNDACLLFVSHAFYMYCDIKWVLHNKIVQCRILTYNLFLKNITTSFKTCILI